MAEFALGTYWRVSEDDWPAVSAVLTDTSDFFNYEGYWYIYNDDYDDEYLTLLEADLFLEQYDYLKSSIHFGY